MSSLKTNSTLNRNGQDNHHPALLASSTTLGGSSNIALEILEGKDESIDVGDFMGLRESSRSYAFLAVWAAADPDFLYRLPRIQTPTRARSSTCRLLWRRSTRSRCAAWSGRRLFF